MKKRKVGRPGKRISTMIGLLSADPITRDELVERTLLSPGTVDLYLNYELKKLGYVVIKEAVMGRLAYRIEKKK